MTDTLSELDALPHHVKLFRMNRGRWPSLGESEFEHEWRWKRAAALLDQMESAETRGASRTSLAAMRAEFDERRADLEASRRFLDAEKARIDGFDWETLARRRGVLLRRHLGFIPE